MSNRILDLLPEDDAAITTDAFIAFMDIFAHHLRTIENQQTSASRFSNRLPMHHSLIATPLQPIALQQHYRLFKSTCSLDDMTQCLHQIINLPVTITTSAMYSGQLSEHQLTRLHMKADGFNLLGQSTLLGKTLWQANKCLAITVGPLTQSQWRQHFLADDTCQLIWLFKRNIKRITTLLNKMPITTSVRVLLERPSPVTLGVSAYLNFCQL